MQAMGERPPPDEIVPRRRKPNQSKFPNPVRTEPSPCPNQFREHVGGLGHNVESGDGDNETCRNRKQFDKFCDPRETVLDLAGSPKSAPRAQRQPASITDAVANNHACVALAQEDCRAWQRHINRVKVAQKEAQAIRP